MARAVQSAERAARAFEQQGSLENYGYGDRPVREEIVEQIHDHGALAAVISRNSYGALVLNTDRTMFVDVDHPSSAREKSVGGAPLVAALLGLFGRGKRTRPVAPNRDAPLLERFQRVVESSPGLGIRVYRTAAGYRLLVTSETHNPRSAATESLMTAFGSDPLYIRLCKAQDCFRARLSAKFWRCGVTRPPSRYPWQDEQQEAHYRRWEQSYHARANRFATCALVTTLGTLTVDAAVQPILDVHDRLTLLEGAPLA